MTTETHIRVASTVPVTQAEGPGRRFAVWVQGCAVRCDGCFNPHMWSPWGGTPTAPDALLEQIPLNDVEGVTLLGGEPFEQAKPLARFADLARREGLTVMTFTGHLRESLEHSADPGVAELLATTDLLVAGPYVAEQRDLVRPWVGSTNQQFHFLTDRYQHLQDQLASVPDRIEVRVRPSGEVSINGWAPIEQLDDLLMETAKPLRRGSVR